MKPWWQRPGLLVGCVVAFFFLTLMMASIRVGNESLAEPAPITTTYKNLKCYPQAGDLICPGQAPTFPPGRDIPQQP